MAGIPQQLVDEARHRGHHLRRSVIGPGQLAQRVVVRTQEVFVEVEPGVGIAPADHGPVHRVEHADQRGQRGLKRVLAVHAVGEHPEGGAHHGVCRGKRPGDAVQAVLERDALRPRHQQAEGDRLGVAVGELRVRRLGEEQAPPVLGQSGERLCAEGELLRHLVPQEAAQPGAHVRQTARAGGRDRLPPQEVGEEALQAGGRPQACARGLHVAFEPDDLALEPAVAPQRERVSVGVDDVGQGLQLLPLPPVVLVPEPAGVGALARGLHLDVAGQGVPDLHGVIRPGPQRGQRRLADRDHLARLKQQEGGHVRQQGLERGAELILGSAQDSFPRQLRLDGYTEAGCCLGQLVGRDHANAVSCSAHLSEGKPVRLSSGVRSHPRPGWTRQSRLPLSCPRTPESPRLIFQSKSCRPGDRALVPIHQETCLDRP